MVIMNHSGCSCIDRKNIVMTPNYDVIQTIIITVLVSVCFVITKSAYDEVRHIMSRVTVIVIGAGPIGLLSLIIAAKCGRVSSIIIYEEKSRFELLNNNYQIVLDINSVALLRTLGIDFDNMEGCWDKGTFCTRIGILLEYLLSSLTRLDIPVDLRLNTKVSKHTSIITVYIYMDTLLRCITEYGKHTPIISLYTSTLY